MNHKVTYKGAEFTVEDSERTFKCSNVSCFACPFMFKDCDDTGEAYDILYALIEKSVEEQIKELEEKLSELKKERPGKSPEKFWDKIESETARTGIVDFSVNNSWFLSIFSDSNRDSDNGGEKNPPVLYVPGSSDYQLVNKEGETVPNGYIYIKEKKEIK